MSAGNVPDFLSAVYELTCTDTGIGMSEEFQKRAFEPFAQEGQSARTKYAGTGLGLAIARKLIELQRGTLFFESIQGKGTKFILHISFEISAGNVPDFLSAVYG